jgi:hypothetical protein
LVRKSRDVEAFKERITSRVREQIVLEKTLADTAIRRLFQSAQVIDTALFLVLLIFVLYGGSPQAKRRQWVIA